MPERQTVSDWIADMAMKDGGAVFVADTIPSAQAPITYADLRRLMETVPRLSPGERVVPVEVLLDVKRLAENVANECGVTCHKQNPQACGGSGCSGNVKECSSYQAAGVLLVINTYLTAGPESHDA